MFKLHYSVDLNKLNDDDDDEKVNIFREPQSTFKVMNYATERQTDRQRDKQTDGRTDEPRHRDALCDYYFVIRHLYYFSL